MKRVITEAVKEDVLIEVVKEEEAVEAVKEVEENHMKQGDEYTKSVSWSLIVVYEINN